jgi:hypothetical protein
MHFLKIVQPLASDGNNTQEKQDWRQVNIKIVIHPTIQSKSENVLLFLSHVHDTGVLKDGEARERCKLYT